MSAVDAGRRGSGRWMPGPEHRDYAYTGAYGYPVIEPETTPPARKRQQRVPSGRKSGPIMASRYILTPEGAEASGRRSTATETAGTRREGELLPASECRDILCFPDAPAHLGQHVYRAVDVLTPDMLDAAGATMLRWFVPVGLVLRDGKRRSEVVS